MQAVMRSEMREWLMRGWDSHKKVIWGGDYEIRRGQLFSKRILRWEGGGSVSELLQT